MTSHSRRRLLHVVLAGGVTLFASIVLCVTSYLWWLKPGYEALPFSREAWLLADAETRGHMVKSLLTTRDLRGLPQRDLLDLLGPPDGRWTAEEAWARDGQWATEPQLRAWYGSRGPGFLSHAVWKLGYMGFRPEAPFSFTYWLHVSFRDRRVSGFRIDD